jgi:hypothetical protein
MILFLMLQYTQEINMVHFIAWYNLLQYMANFLSIHVFQFETMSFAICVKNVGFYQY